MLNLNNQYVVINGRDSRDFGIYVIDGNIFDFAIRDFEAYQVPGRTGDLTFDHGRWKNITLTLKCAALDNGREKLDAWRAFLLSGMSVERSRTGGLRSGFYGSYRIETSIEPEIYRLGVVKSVSSPQISLADGGGYVEVSFDCSPKKYLKSGEEVMEADMRNVTIRNPSYYDAKPSMLITAANEGDTFSITNYIYDETGLSISREETITLTLHTTMPLYIDCETRNAVRSATGANYNQYVSLSTSVSGGTIDFPYFMGKSALPRYRKESSFYVSNGVTISLNPRWWTL